MSKIDYSKLRSLTARTLISALKKNGFLFERQEGSHQTYRHPDGRQVTVSFHGLGEIFPPKTRSDMIELQAKWTLEDLRRLKLVK